MIYSTTGGAVEAFDHSLTHVNLGDMSDNKLLGTMFEGYPTTSSGQLKLVTVDRMLQEVHTFSSYGSIVMMPSGEVDPGLIAWYQQDMGRDPGRRTVSVPSRSR